MRRKIPLPVCWVTALVLLLSVSRAGAQPAEPIGPGIWKISLGTPEAHRPMEFKFPMKEEALSKLPSPGRSPLAALPIQFRLTPQGALATFPMDSTERIHGFGLQVNAFEQRGLRREIRTNSWVVGNVGFSHAPMPFYISSKGYGVLVNTARYVTFYMGSQHSLEQSVALKSAVGDSPAAAAASTADLYNSNYKPSNDVQILVSGTQGMELIVFEGPTMRTVVERYNLFSGGGALPPLWGLGFKYRAKNTFNQAEVLDFIQYFRRQRIPCDMFGLEPGWHSAAYSCSFSWNKKNFPDPDRLLDSVQVLHYRLNLWEHAYVHPSSPLFDSIVPWSGDYAVWKGAVPDFITPQARRVFGNYHRDQLVRRGVSAFKLDECDAAYYTEAQGEWSFPDIAHFPSGVDGVQMRQLFGLLYQKTIGDVYRGENQRTLLDVRASHLFAAPYAAVLYSDMYNHADYVRMIVNSGFCGVNWSPEVRETRSQEDLIRRLQTSLMSAQMVVDCWFLKNLPWYQYDREKNNRGELLPNYKELELKAKRLIELRMSLIPYLYAAFARYHYEGTPPFRALVLDYPEDPQVWQLDSEYMMGESMLCAPFLDGASTREVYLPKGTWYDFNSGKRYEGGKKYTITMSLDEVPVFVRQGAILPLARPVPFVTPETVFELTCRVYGNGKASVRLFEDNGETFDYEQGHYGWCTLTWNKGAGSVRREGPYRKTRYKIISWEKIE